MTNSGEEIIVGIADLKIGAAPQRLRTTLGSCVAVCLYAANQQVGGLLHVMMPYAGAARERPDFKKSKYADSGIAELLRRLNVQFGVTAGDLTAKIFGAAKILSQVSQDIGGENAAAVRQVLSENGIRIVSHKLGGPRGYKVSFCLESGRVRCEVFGEAQEEY